MAESHQTTSGQILNYQVQTGQGIILAQDGNRYAFTNQDWLSNEAPQQGDNVTFTITSGEASNIQVTYSTHHPAQRQQFGSKLPEIAAGCGAGCLTIFVATIVAGAITTALSMPELPATFLRVMSMTVIPAVAGITVYRIVKKNRSQR